MRLRLEVLRNELPPLKVLLQAGEDQTVAEFLGYLNAFVPLESQEWDLEDYVLETEDGFETLHYQTVGSILKENERVRIRPLSSTEIRTRRLTGRTQIHPSGARLLDGVVFGRPLLKIPSRAPVHIPPRRRLAYGSIEQSGVKGLLALDDEDDDDDEDADFLAGSVIAVHNVQPRRSDRLAGHEDVASSVDWSEEEEQLLLENGRLHSEEGSLDSAVEEEIEPHGRPRKRARLADSSFGSVIDSAKSNPDVPPGMGSARTRARNKRRSQSRKLDHLKQQGTLPAEATMKDLSEHLAAVHTPQREDGLRPSSGEASLDSESSLSSDSDRDSDSSSDGSDDESSSAPSVHTSREVTSPTIPQSLANGDSSKSEEFQARRDALLTALANGGVDVGSPSSSSPSMNKSQSERSKSLDVRAAQRLVLGALGHRAPRNEEQRAALIAKIDAANTRKPKPMNNGHKEDTNGVAANLAAEDDPDFWKSHIELSAVDCSGNVQLSTPPFPFYPQWDPSQQASRKRKRQQQDYSGADTDAEYWQNETVHLDYDDPPNGDVGESPEFLGFQDEAEDDFPPLPEDLTTLPAIAEADIIPGDILVFSNLEVSAATKWMPAMAGPRTAKVLNETFAPGQPLMLQLAFRDCPPRAYDDDGNRVFEKFEMADEDDESEGELELGFGELVEPKLLSRGELKAQSSASGNE